MQFLKIFAIIVLSVTALILLALYIKSRKPVKNLIVNAFSGIAVLVIINLSARFTGIHIPVNWWSALTASGLGIPGVTGLILLQIIMPL